MLLFIHSRFNDLCSQCLALFTICTSIFDLYCLSQAAPGSTHYGYYIISYEFVYVGNRHGEFQRVAYENFIGSVYRTNEKLRVSGKECLGIVI